MTFTLRIVVPLAVVILAGVAMGQAEFPTVEEVQWRVSGSSAEPSSSVHHDRRDDTSLPGFTCEPNSNYTGNFLGAPYQVVIPANFNKVLIVYAHGYSLTQPSGPLLSLPGGAATALLAKGYGIVASAYRARWTDIPTRTGGWAVEQALQDLAALTSAVNLYGCNADHTILFGISMGSVVALSSAERYPNVYDGVIAGCAAGAGTTSLFDASLIVNMVYDAAFMDESGKGGWPDEWGTPHEVPYNISFTNQVYVPVLARLGNTSNALRWAFVQMVGQVPAQNSAEFARFFLSEIYFSTEGVAELQRRTGTTKVTQSVGRHFTLTSEQISYLTSQGFDAQRALDYMNARTNYTSDPAARSFFRRYADYTGRIRVPVMTMHTIADELITTSSETVYKELLEATGKSHLLYQAYFSERGHCQFNSLDVVQTVDAMRLWLDQGTKPSNSSFADNPNYLSGYNPGPYIYA